MLSLVESHLARLQAASMRLPPNAAFAGFTACWLHGLDVEPCNPIEVTVPSPTTISTRAGILVHRRRLDKQDVVRRKGLPATVMIRSLRDLCVRTSVMEAVVLMDMALHARLVSLAAICSAVDQNFGAAGVKVLREALPHAEAKAESPMESRLRMRLVLAGLPRPEAQVEIWDGTRFLGRIDLYYREKRLGLEYDGGIHRDRLAEDNRRQNRLLDAGVRLLRFTASDIYNTPDQVVSLVRGALGAKPLSSRRRSRP